MKLPRKIAKKTGLLVTVDSELIEHLYQCPKVVPGQVSWDANDDVDYEHYQFNREVFAEDHAEVLQWFGWFKIESSGERRWGFKLEYQQKYEVRSWDMAHQHYSSEQDEWVRGVGQHKHYYKTEKNPRAVYEIPEGEISIEDPNQSVIDFCEECNMSLTGGYQPRIFPL